MKKRKATEAYLLKSLTEIDPTGFNHDTYKKYFDKWSDEEFDAFMERLSHTQLHIFDNPKINFERNEKIAEKLGISFLSPLSYHGTEDSPGMITKAPFLNLPVIIRRPSQTLAKGKIVPDNNMSRDALTGQVTGVSSGNKLTGPEIAIFNGHGMDKTIEEFFRLRGGDLGASRALDGLLGRYGKATQSQIESYSTGVVSTNTVKSLFRAVHIKLDA